jgi:hypothetical protein
MENPISRMKKAFYVIINLKGGVGKTTQATQVLAPYFYQMLNNGELPTKDSILPRVYEIDDENNSQQSLEKSGIIASRLIKNPKAGLQEVLIKEASDLERNYPVIIDVGVANVNEALATVTSVLKEEDLVFFVPVKPDEVDTNNSKETVNKILNQMPNAKFVFVCSDSQWRYGEVDELKDEFGIMFGNWYDPVTGNTRRSLFELFDVDADLYVHVPRDDVFAQAKFSERKTVYEMALEQKAIEKGQKKETTQKEYAQMILDAKEKNEKPKIAKLMAQKEKALRLGTMRSRCLLYLNNSLNPLFDDMKALLVSKIFNK